MGVGSLGGIAFTIDPSSVAYHFDVKSSTTNTVGGKVVQVYGVRVSELMVTGQFGTGGIEAQQSFLEGIQGQMTAQVGTYTPKGYVQGSPVRFLYPPRGWDFEVYLLNYSQPGGSSSIVLDNSIINPQWTLTMFIANDNGALASVQDAALASYLSGLSSGLGWNGNVNTDPVSTQVSVNSPATGGSASTPGGGSTSGSNPTGTGRSPSAS